MSPDLVGQFLPPSLQIPVFYQCGYVFHAPQFSDGDIQDKVKGRYYIVMNLNPSQDHMLLLYTFTTQFGRAMRDADNPTLGVNRNMVAFFKKGTLSFLRDDSVVEAWRKPMQWSKTRIAELNEQKPNYLKGYGVLPSPILYDIRKAFAEFGHDKSLRRKILPHGFC